MIVERQVFYQGRVQGVGFRYTVKQIAAGYEVVGWVRNLPGGQVEIQARGEESEINGFLDAILGGHLRQNISHHQENEIASLEKSVTGFEIRH